MFDAWAGSRDGIISYMQLVEMLSSLAPPGSTPSSEVSRLILITILHAHPL